MVALWEGALFLCARYPCSIHTVEHAGFVASDFEGYVTKFALKPSAFAKLTIDKRFPGARGHCSRNRRWPQRHPSYSVIVVHVLYM